jgi:hypothetical protein
MKCTQLKSLQFFSSTSVNVISFQSTETFSILGGELFPSLQSIRTMFELFLLDGLEPMLNVSSSIRSVTFYQRKRWLESSVWTTAENNLDLFRKQFPFVTLSLEDDSNK